MSVTGTTPTEKPNEEEVKPAKVEILDDSPATVQKRREKEQADLAAKEKNK